MLNSVKRLAVSLAMTSIGLGGCYVVPINKEGAYSVYPAGQAPVVQVPVPTTLNVVFTRRTMSRVAAVCCWRR